MLELSAFPASKKNIGSPCSSRPTPCLLEAAMSCICAAGCASPDWQTSFASLRHETVYVGVSAGSMVVTSHIGETYVGHKPPSGNDIKSEDIVLATPRENST